DPWSAEGQKASTNILPVAADLRTHAERAILLIAQARAANPRLWGWMRSRRWIWARGGLT
ncbi:MAG: hypothetical protein ABSD43_10365, partial [Terracidiphilus sp.]